MIALNAHSELSLVKRVIRVLMIVVNAQMGNIKIKFIKLLAKIVKKVNFNI